MADYHPEQIAKWAKGSWVGKMPDAISGFSIDTRTIGMKEMFVAIRDKRDGHEYLEFAQRKGASCGLVNRLCPEVKIPQLEVSDTLLAFQEIGRGFRNSFTGKVVGITGSCGKTSTKDMLSLILGDQETHSTQGNLNNHLGIPLTLVGINPSDHRWAVIEAGINSPGEMRNHSRMISPNLVLVTSIGHSHLEGLGNVENVAREKAALFQESKETEKVIFPESCLKFESFAEWLNEEKPCTILKRGKPDSEPKKSEAYYDFWTETNNTGRSVTIRLWRHRSPVFSISIPPVSDGIVSNMALSILAACELGLTDQRISERLPQYRPSALRGKRLQGRGRTYYLDCYNANPSSMLDSLNFFSKEFETEAKMYVLGGMEELGEEERILHAQVGASQKLGSRDLVLLIGEKAHWMAEGYLNAGAQIDQLIPLQSIEDARSMVDDFEGALLFKGSRAHRLEELIPTWAVDHLPEEEFVGC